MCRGDFTGKVHAEALFFFLTPLDDDDDVDDAQLREKALTQRVHVRTSRWQDRKGVD